MDFYRFAEAYEHEVETATRFAQLPAEFFLEVKVAHLLDRLRQKFEHLKQLRVLDVGSGVGLTDQLPESSPAPSGRCGYFKEVS
jgi:2-polyprenyl-3-methyl-5-hydroxy-6-metoxy-1,4-benzoquinol methylase